MARIVTYTVVMAVLSVILTLGGINTGSHMLLSALGFGADYSVGTLLIAMGAILAIGTTVGTVTIGFFSTTITESKLLAGFSGTLLVMSIADMAGIISYFNGVCGTGSGCLWASWIVATVYTGLIAGYIISIAQWWRGNDI